ADERLQRLRAAAEVVDGDVEALLLEVAKPLGDGQRQIVERGFAANAERDLLLFGGLSLRGAHERQRSCKDCKEQSHRSHVVLPPSRQTGGGPAPCYPGGTSTATGRQASSRRSASVTAKSITMTKAASTRIPANTPVTSSDPSACKIR